MPKRHQPTLDELWNSMQYTAGDYSHQQIKFKFPLPPPVSGIKGGVDSSRSGEV